MHFIKFPHSNDSSTFILSLHILRFCLLLYLVPSRFSLILLKIWPRRKRFRLCYKNKERLTFPMSSLVLAKHFFSSKLWKMHSSLGVHAPSGCKKQACVRSVLRPCRGVCYCNSVSKLSSSLTSEFLHDSLRGDMNKKDENTSMVLQCGGNFLTTPIGYTSTHLQVF
jgi:hypothetical protein